jgi:hypothetical protein
MTITVIFRKAMIAHDKGKPTARQGRKAVSLRERTEEGVFSNPSVPAEIVWLPKAIRESHNFKQA